MNIVQCLHKLILHLKYYLLILLISLSTSAYAEYYLVCSPVGVCGNPWVCKAERHHAKHKSHYKHHHSYKHRQHHQRDGYGMSVYYVWRVCSPCAYGGMWVPVNSGCQYRYETPYWYNEEEVYTYPDMTTGDDDVMDDPDMNYGY